MVVFFEHDNSRYFTNIKMRSCRKYLEDELCNKITVEQCMDDIENKSKPRKKYSRVKRHLRASGHWVILIQSYIRKNPNYKKPKK